MKKVKILEVNSVDLVGNRYNGYDMIDIIGGKEFDVKQAVVEKKSDNPKVIPLLKNDVYREIHEKFVYFEEVNESIKNVLSITTPSLIHSKEYKEADIIHFHMFHNSGISLYALKKITQDKKVIISLHDPWFLTGRCVHFYDCDKWKTGCKNCGNLKTLFALNEDNCSELWELKRKVFEDLDVDLIIPTDWLLNLVKESPILKNIKNKHKILFGIDKDKFSKITYKEARKKLGIEDDEIVFFHRAQNEFKGTPYVLEALKMMDANKKITILTCEGKGLLDEVKDKFNIRDLGLLNDEQMIVTMNACDIFLMPSIGENAGLMAVEAMTCCKPVIIFNNTGLPYVTHAPECGYLVKNRDSKDLKKAMEYLMENKAEREKRGKLGRKIVEKEYSNEIYYDSLRKTYREVYNRKQKASKVEIPEPTKNSEQFKYHLNDITVRLFGTSDKISKELIYKVKDKKIKDYKYDYSDLALQELLWNYENKLYELIENYNVKLTNTVRKKIEKLIYVIKNNPDYLKTKITSRLKRK